LKAATASPADIGRSYAVDPATICRLAAAHSPRRIPRACGAEAMAATYEASLLAI